MLTMSILALGLIFPKPQPVNPNLYAKPAIICEVGKGENLVETPDGNLWSFWGTGYRKGDKVTVTFDSNGTETIYDDKIVEVKK